MAHERGARSAQGGADRDLALPGRGAREQQTRDVRARDQQHKSHRTQHDEEGRTKVVRVGTPEQQPPERSEGCAHAGVGRRVLPFEAAAHSREMRVRLGERDPVA